MKMRRGGLVKVFGGSCLMAGVRDFIRFNILQNNIHNKKIIKKTIQKCFSTHWYVSEANLS